MRSKISIVLAAAALMCGCFDDKGNYDYRELPQVTIENVPELLELLGNSDHIKVEPRIVSSTEGEITADNPNFSFYHALEKKSGGWIVSGQRWVTLNPSGALNIDTLATFTPDTYVGLFKVTDNRTGIEYHTSYEIKVTSPTYEGWLVLCNEGADNRVRMDMISVISADRIVPAYDLLTSLGLPYITNATMIGFNPTFYVRGDEIYVLSKDGAYKLNKDTFTTNESWNIRYIDFAIPPSEDIKMCAYYPMYASSFIDRRAVFGFTTDGNVYCLVGATAGTAFESPINTSVRGGEPEFKVAPYAGYSMARPGHGNAALLYDVDNLRFVGWRYGTVVDARHTLTPLSDPETGSKLFSFNTGMELIYMESTRFSDGMVYSILQDAAGKRHIYGINMSGNGFAQEAYYPNVDAPDFGRATQFAFHSQFPFMFYSVGNKVYLHNLGTGVTYPMSNINLGTSEEVTLLKFNLYVTGGLEYLNNQTDEFMARQYELMVGSYDTTAGDNGGKLGFYPVNGTNNSVSKRAEYTGFARIKDVVYRERR